MISVIGKRMIDSCKLPMRHAAVMVKPKLVLTYRTTELTNTQKPGLVSKRGKWPN